MSVTSVSNLRLGILGAGQLSLMLCEAAKKLNFHIKVLAESSAEPAFGFAGKENTSIALEKTEAQLHAFLSKVDRAIFESEFWDCELLKRAALSTSAQFFPTLDCISLIQDKLNQKHLFEKLEIQSSPFSVLNAPLESTLGKVLKWSRQGYDGKGVFVFSDLSHLSDLITFCENAQKKQSQIYVEDRVQFRRELAMTAVRSSNSEYVFYPLVVSEQKNGICKRVFGPAHSFGVNEKLEDQAKVALAKIGNELSLVGAFTLEFFETFDERLLVNELAPRVHNSAHYTQDACDVSQFENHLRACAGMPLLMPASKNFFAMINLLGQRNRKADALTLHEGATGMILHWYAKQEERLGRKMGHVNIVAETKKELATILRIAESLESKWLATS